MITQSNPGLLEIELKLPRPHPLQRAIMDSKAKRKVIASGRQVGKTTGVAIISSEAMLQGKNVLYISTSIIQTDAFWGHIKRIFRPLLDRGYVLKNETRRMLTFPATGGEIQARTGSDPDTLRSGNTDLLILDECAFLNPAAWNTVGAPMLMARNGDAIFISTPNRKNWFYFLYLEAKADQSGYWQAWNVTSHDNPHLDPDALARMVDDMTEESYRQEILAEFMESGGEVFRGVEKIATLTRSAPYEGEFVFGIDWAMSKDKTAVAVFDKAKKELVDLDYFNGVDWHLQRGRVRAMYDKWKPRIILAEQNSIGGPNIEALSREGLPMRSFTTTAQSKPPLIEGLALAIERAEIKILKDTTLTGELSAYERIVSANTGRSQYSAPLGMHDDTVIALALAYHAATLTKPRLSVW